jgi:hypothetical protein
VKRTVLATGFLALLLAMTWLALPGRTPETRAAYPAADLNTGLVFDCLGDGKLSVDLRWASSNLGPQWVDLSTHDNDFAGGSFLGHGPLVSGGSALTWYGIEPRTRYFVRVNTLTYAGWFASPTMIFDSPADCHSTAPPAHYPGPATCDGLRSDELTGCVWTDVGDWGSYDIGDNVTYCYYPTQPAEVQVIATKPDDTTLLVASGYANATTACIGPFQAWHPSGLRTVRFYGDGRLLDVKHFYVE